MLRNKLALSYPEAGGEDEHTAEEDSHDEGEGLLLEERLHGVEQPTEAAMEGANSGGPGRGVLGADQNGSNGPDDARAAADSQEVVQLEVRNVQLLVIN